MAVLLATSESGCLELNSQSGFPLNNGPVRTTESSLPARVHVSPGCSPLVQHLKPCLSKTETSRRTNSGLPTQVTVWERGAAIVQSPGAVSCGHVWGKPTMVYKERRRQKLEAEFALKSTAARGTQLTHSHRIHTNLNTHIRARPNWTVVRLWLWR